MRIRKLQIKNKGQLKIQEMAFMLMAVVIFFIIAGLFFLAIKSRELYREANLIEKEKAISMIAKLADSAEFTCGKPLCIDADKLIVIQDREDYDEFWQLSSLEVVKIFPKQELVKCNKNNYPACNLFKIYDKNVNQEKVSTFVSLCRKEKQDSYFYEKCEIGKIIAGFEVKEPK